MGHGILAWLGARAERNAHYRADIDGLRAIAVTSVVLFHAKTPLVQSGFVGVDVFFVISGYLIGGIILAEMKARQFTFAAFYARRARRILPALLVVLAFTLAVGSLLMSASEFRLLGASTGASALGVSNLFYLRWMDYFAPHANLNPLLMTWSLGVEEQFYLLFPLLLVLINRIAPKATLGVLAAVTLSSFLLSLWCTTHYPSVAFYTLPTRAWELGIGCLLAAVQNRGNAPALGQRMQDVLGMAGLVVVLASATLLSPQTPFPGWAALVPVLGTAALLAAPQSFVNRALLSSTPAVFIGLISYSWYLWHWPLLTFLRLGAAGEPQQWMNYAAVAVSLVAAWLSWRFVEQPLRARVLERSRVLWRYASAVGVVLTLGLVARLGGGWPQRLAPEVAQIEAAADFAANSCLTGWGQEANLNDIRCQHHVDGRPMVALLGDSHAAALAPGFRRTIDELGLGYEVLTMPSCRPLLGVTTWQRERPNVQNDCATFMRHAILAVAEDPEVHTVVLAGLWHGPLINPAVEHYQGADDGAAITDGRELLRVGLSNAIETLVAHGKRVIVLGDSPSWSFDPARLSIIEAIPARRYLAAISGGIPRRDALTIPEDEIGEPVVRSVSEAFAASGRVTYLDLYPYFCGTDAACAYQEGDALLFVDHGHLSPRGAERALADLPTVLAAIGNTEQRRTASRTP